MQIVDGIFKRSATTLAVFALATLFRTPAIAQWSNNPNINNPISTATGTQQNPVIVSDGAGGAIIAWNDYRSDPSNSTNSDVYAQRIDVYGIVRWTTDGVPICTATNNQFSVHIVSDGTGGAIIAWEDNRNGTDYDVYAQRIDSTGVVQWTANGVPVSTATGGQYLTTLIPDGTGGAIAVWDDKRNGTDFDVYAQRINASGVRQWAVGGDSNGVVVCNSSKDQDEAVAATDGSGGAIITWMDYRNDGGSGTNIDIYAQRVNASGIRQWIQSSDTNGIVICNQSNNQLYPAIASNGAGGAYITWQDYRSGTNDDIYVQMISANGIVQFYYPSGGFAVCTAANNQLSPVITADGLGGAVISWSDNRNGANSDVYAQRVASTGAMLWQSNGVPVSTASTDQTSPVLIGDGAGGATIAWDDSRNGYSDIYAQRLSASGTPLWIAGSDSNGFAVTTAVLHQTGPVIASDGNGGAIVAWNDSRATQVGAYTGASDIYCQNIDRNGYLGSTVPTIVAARDIADDQGGHIRLLWTPSYLDASPNAIVRSYTILMGTASTGVPGAVADKHTMSFGRTTIASNATGGIFWQTVGSVPADWLTGYSTVVHTYADSGLQGTPVYYFQVIAVGADSGKSWSSNVCSGYSVDNIPPTAPLATAIVPLSGGPIELHWHPDVTDPDFGYFSIYRSSVSGFTPSPSNRLSITKDTLFIDSSSSAGSNYYYRICTVDIHGNQSTPTKELSALSLAVQLTSFTVSSNRLSTQLEWTTATEINLFGFEVQRCYRGDLFSGTQNPASNWTDVAFVSGSGTSSGPRSYA
ncbi:MAG TPA: hypothetical protein VI758_11050, partial [Bacteroidota bacterium]